MKFKIFSIASLLFCSVLTLYSQAGTSARKYNMIRSDDDFTFLQHDSLRADIFDPIKHISLADKKQMYLSMGGEMRHQYQWYQNPEWDGTVDNNGHFLQRYMLHADVHLGKRFRIFTQLNSGFSHGRNPAPRRIIDENKVSSNWFQRCHNHKI